MGHGISSRVLSALLGLVLLVVAPAAVAVDVAPTTAAAPVYDPGSHSSESVFIASAAARVSTNNSSASTAGGRSAPQPVLVAAETGEAATSNLPKLGAKPNFTNPAESPGNSWEWRGTGDPGSTKSSWYNPPERVFTLTSVIPTRLALATTGRPRMGRTGSTPTERSCRTDPGWAGVNRR